MVPNGEVPEPYFALANVHGICRGYTDTVDADLSKYFDSIPHSELLKSVARRVVDRNVLRLINRWLKAPIEERDEDGTRRMSGGKRSKCGTPQGGVASPLFANIYMNRFLRYWRLSGCGEGFCAHVVSYADDLVILSRGHAAEALAWTKAVMSASPSKNSVKRFKTKIGNLLTPANTDPWPDVLDQLNSMLRGWSNYFCHGTRRAAYRAVDRYVYERVRDFLARRHKVAGRGTRRFSCEIVYKRGLLRLERLPLNAPPCASQ